MGKWEVKVADLKVVTLADWLKKIYNIFVSLKRGLLAISHTVTDHILNISSLLVPQYLDSGGGFLKKVTKAGHSISLMCRQRQARPGKSHSCDTQCACSTDQRTSLASTSTHFGKLLILAWVSVPVSPCTETSHNRRGLFTLNSWGEKIGFPFGISVNDFVPNLASKTANQTLFQVRKLDLLQKSYYEMK